MRQLFYAFVIGILVLLSSCRQDFDFEHSTGGLEFSKDTVYLDTVFTNIGSSTYRLKVYNKSNKNISIPSLKLEKGISSKYRLMVDGIAGQEFKNVEMLAKDSMYIFISVTADVADANPTDFLYTDKILFGDELNPNHQKVELVTLIQDAYFIYPQRTLNPDNTFTYESLTLGVDDEGNPIKIRGQFLDENDPVNGNELHWTNEKPYVIYGYAAVPSTKTLVVDAGAKIHFHADSGLIVAQNGSIEVNGTLTNPAQFEGDRLEPDFSDTPGQWGTIWLNLGSTGNFNNAIIKNATVGLLIDKNSGTINLKNVQIYNCSNYGILAKTATLNGENMVINNCGDVGLACSLGGNYNFSHCTFANYWPRPNQVPVSIDNGDGTADFELINARFDNCIIYGSSSYGIALKKFNPNDNFPFTFNHCLIRFSDFGQFQTDPLYPLANTTDYPGSIIAKNSFSNSPKFQDPQNNKLKIGDDSICIGQGDVLSVPVPFDILGNSRPNGGADLGAYNHETF